MWTESEENQNISLKYLIFPRYHHTPAFIIILTFTKDEHYYLDLKKEQVFISKK
jgi:hypothetical protein